MIYTQIIQALSEILQIKYEAKVSGLGKIYIHKYSAKILKDSGQITPPSFKAKVSLDKNVKDNELADFLVNHYQIKRKKANKAIENWVKVCWASKRKNSIKLIGLSDSKFKKAKSKFYENSEALVLAPNYLAYYPIDLKEYQRHSTTAVEEENEETQIEDTAPIVQSSEFKSSVEDLAEKSGSELKLETSTVSQVNTVSKSNTSEPKEEKLELREIPIVETHKQVARQESTHLVKPIVKQEINESNQKPLAKAAESVEARVVPMPESESPILKWFGRTAILLLLLLGVFYLFLPEGFNNLFSTNIPINQKPGYEKVLSSNIEEIPKHIEAEEKASKESNTDAAVNEVQSVSNTASENVDSNSERQTNTISQTTNADDFNYKIIIGRFSNELNIKQLKERLDAEGYHYFAELENGLYTIGVKIKSNPASIHTQLQHFVDYYTWDAYFKRIK